ncbi:unannotated protein [freshwater metagenome]|uniref:Unannotated protein n=1 Tax=freshwater metagenome TaxID=449393 RepID=A0A6J7IFY3_9ZZZZ
MAPPAVRVRVLVLEVLEQPAALAQEFDEVLVSLLEEQAADHRDVVGERAIGADRIYDG